MRIDSLESTPFPLIHGCFIQAFGDYAVNMSTVTERVLKRRARKNNWFPELSIGAWEDGDLVAITLVGVDDVAGEKTAYDICTGVIPGFRGKGLAGGMLNQIRPTLLNAKIGAMQLEVLEENSAAINAYKRAGFREIRGLVSYVGSIDSVNSHSTRFHIKPVDCEQLFELSMELDYQPSFEQRDQAIENLERELIMLGAFQDGQLVAAVAHDPHTEWLMRVVTRRTHRRQGAASVLLKSLVSHLEPGQPIKAINLDASDEPSIALMRSIGLKKLLGQKEMRLDLNS